MDSLQVSCHSHSRETHLAAGAGATPPRLNEMTPTYTHLQSHTQLYAQRPLIGLLGRVWIKVDVGQQLLLLVKEEEEEVCVREGKTENVCVCVWNKNSSHTELAPHTDNGSPVCEAKTLRLSLPAHVSSLAQPGLCHFLSGIYSHLRGPAFPYIHHIQWHRIHT